MSRYIYTVTSKKTGKVIAEGFVGECAEITGLSCNTLRNMAVGAHDSYITPPRLKYIVTRTLGDDRPSVNAKHYSVYSKETDELITSGTSAECAKALGWKNIKVFHRLMTREKHTGSTKYEFRAKPHQK